MATSNMNLVELIKTAWDAGQKMSIPEAKYGRIHWGNKQDISEFTFPYYRFLAGFAKSIESSNVCEIGTHWGGSAIALCSGSHGNGDPKVLTYDVTNESDNLLPHVDNSRFITKYVGDANTVEAVDYAADFFEDSIVDILYIDALHLYFPALMNYSLYTAVLRPRFVILDDITLSQPMMNFWSAITSRLDPDNYLNVTDFIPEVRPGSDAIRPGFGIIRF